jgi:CO dehydrogenase maturation factor
MAVTVAVAGKGGTGKTTISGLLIKYIGQCLGKTVLAIDADPSSNLNSVLGLQLEKTVGDIREDMLGQVRAKATVASAMPGGMSKQDYLNYQVQLALVEGDQADLIAMGRPEGQGCYCAANQMMRVIIDRMSDGYDYVVMDNEAGMEHLSRRTTRDVEHLLVVSDASQRGLTAAHRIVKMVPTLDVNIKNMSLVLNRAPALLPPALTTAIAQLDIELAGVIPNDAAVSDFDMLGKPLVDLPVESPVVRAVWDMAERLLDNNRHR